MTELGFLGAGPLADVDERGVATLHSWIQRLDWWVGAEDRWRFASDEAAVRQMTGDDGASISTRMKVPGGDIVQRSYVVPLDGSGGLVLEFENETPVPVVVALELQGQSAGRVDLDGQVVAVAGRSVLRAGKQVAAFAQGTDPELVRKVVTAGDAVVPADRSANADDASVVALLWPVPHTTTLRVVIPFGDPQPIPQLDYVPETPAVGRGWDAHLNAGLRMTLPDDRLTQMLATARRHILASADQGFDPAPVDSWERALLAAALDQWGHHQVALEILLQLTSSSSPAAERRADHLGATAWALGRHVAITGDTALVDAAETWLTDAVALLAKLATARRPGRLLKSLGDPPAWLSEDDFADWSKEWAVLGLQAASPALEMLDQTQTAQDIRAAVGELNHPAPVLRLWNWLAGSSNEAPPTFDNLLELSATVGPTGLLGSPRKSHDQVASAVALLAARRLLVDDQVRRANHGDERSVDLLASYPDSWTGAGVEVHNAPTVVGPVSYGIRWHGPRPALLWQRAEDHVLSLEEVRWTVPGLDPTWFSIDGRGETLLSGNDVSVEDSPVTPVLEWGEQFDPPSAGESFS